MIKRTSMALAAAIGLSSIQIGGVPAFAATPPRVEAESCSALAQRLPPGQIWRASSAGQRTTVTDDIETYSSIGCFRSEASCKAWLYWVQTDYPQRNGFQPCRRGL